MRALRLWLLPLPRARHLPLQLELEPLAFLLPPIDLRHLLHRRSVPLLLHRRRLSASPARCRCRKSRPPYLPMIDGLLLRIPLPLQPLRDH
jgi:hypothetical protein